MKRPKILKTIPMGVVIFVGLVVLGFYPEAFRKWILEPPLQALRLVLTGVSEISKGSTGLWGRYVHLVDTEKDNRRLRQEVELLHSSLEHYRDLSLKNQELLALLDLRKRTPQQAFACHVIADNSTAAPRTLLLDCGARRGVQVKDGVIGVHGVVGFVVRVFPEFSQVMWIEDSLFALEGRLQDSGQTGLVRGSGTGHLLTLEYIPALSTVEKGTHVVTTGEDGYFPPEELIGTIVSSGNVGHQIFRTVRLESVERLNSLWAVMVLVPPLEWTAKPLLGKEKP